MELNPYDVIMVTSRNNYCLVDTSGSSSIHRGQQFIGIVLKVLQPNSTWPYRIEVLCLLPSGPVNYCFVMNGVYIEKLALELHFVSPTYSHSMSRDTNGDTPHNS